MEYTTEIINISKINEGFFIGDQFAGTNPYILFQFKISHIINASGTQVMNTFEGIGIRYLTLSWIENPSQLLFDSKDEIANKIVSFIDNSLNNGEGLLAHSLKGQDRVCIVVIIYLMKKYNWTLKKSLEFLSSKKKDIIIPKYFIAQLSQFEQRLLKKVGKQSSGWGEEGILKEEEKVMRNTYVNGLPIPKIEVEKEKNHNRGKVGWSNNLVTIGRPDKDLLKMKTIKPITSHMRIRPSKSCIKNRSKSENIYTNNKLEDDDRDNCYNNISIVRTNNDDFNIGKITFGPGSQFSNHPEGNNNKKESINLTNSIKAKSNQKNKTTKPRENNFLKNKTNKENSNNPTNFKIINQSQNLKRPLSSDKISKNHNPFFQNNLPGYIQDNAKYPTYSYMKNQNNDDNKIIITNNYEQYITNNVNNIYIQNSDFIQNNPKYINEINYNSSNNYVASKNPIIRSISASQQNHNLKIGSGFNSSLQKKHNNNNLFPPNQNHIAE